MGLFESLKQKWQRASSLAASLDRILTGRAVISEEMLEELEEALIQADLGVEESTAILEKIKEKASRKTLLHVDQIKQELLEMLVEEMKLYQKPLQEEPLTVALFVGTNGSGKTTTVAKLASFWKEKGRTPLMICADTFRAAATEQLQLWGKKLNVATFYQHEGADPGAVVYDGLVMAKNRGFDTVLIDTAGRVHSKIPLMEQLKKIVRVVQKVTEAAPTDTILVLDAPTGQSGLPVAEKFKEVAGVSSLIMTKLDGTAKGGVLYPVAKALQLPVSFIGVGEKVEDLYPFEAEAFFKALLGLE